MKSSKAVKLIPKGDIRPMLKRKRTIVVIVCILAMVFSFTPMDTLFPIDMGIEEVEAVSVPETVNIPMNGMEWSLQTLDGNTIDQNTYADKTVLLVFFSANLRGDVGVCKNSSSIIKGIADSDWCKNEEIQVIAVDGTDQDISVVSSYKEIYAPDCDDIVFAVNGKALLWRLEQMSINQDSLTFAFCVVVRDQTIRYAWDRCGSSAICRTVLVQELGEDIFVDQDSERGLGVESHTAEEIQNFIDTHPAKEEASTYRIEPSFGNTYSPGVLSDQTLENALNMLNQVRYIAGVDANVTLNTESSEYAAAGTMLNYLNKELSHYPERPAVLSSPAYDSLYEKGYIGTSGSNIAMGYPNLVNAITHGWCADEDPSNIDRVGHRRWFLSPFLSSVGFGVTGRYSAAYVKHDFYKNWGRKYVAWPAQVMPVQYFDASYPWSLSLGTTMPEGGVFVKLIRKSDQKSWDFSSGYADGDFYISNEGYGSPACVIFRPDSLTSIEPGDTFEVTVAYNNYGEFKRIVYQVEFFSLKSKVDISGRIASFGSSSDAVTLRLSDGNGEIDRITTTDSTYELTSVSTGTYTLEVSKPNHAARTYEVTVEDENIIQNVEIHLLGDLDGNGKINTIDVNRAYAHVRGTNPLTGYELKCANVAGTEPTVNTVDVNRIYAHVKGINLLW